MHLVEKGMAIWGTENLQSGESGNVLGDEIRRRSKTHQEKPGLKDGKRALAICCPRLSVLRSGIFQLVGEEEEEDQKPLSHSPM
jgi:hypothetical protein